MRPAIGITASMEQLSLQVSKDNTDAILQAKGMPWIIPYLDDMKTISELAERLDGLFLTGGGDIDPFLFGEEPHPKLGSIFPDRDALEISLIRFMLKANKPILGICRGCQILNIAAGGTMYQDLYAQMEGPVLQHTQKAPRDHASHYVHVEKGTKLYEIVKEGKLKVNSYHHQAVKHLAPGFIVSGKASDGVIEAFEATRHRFVVGVQWHPENLIHSHQAARDLFKAFVDACSCS